MEVWKDIEGYEGLYKISNYGNIVSVKNGKNKPLKHDVSNTTGQKKKTPYCRIMLYKNGKGKLFTIAKLVATHFLGVDNKYNITYKDGDSTNLRYDNLIVMKKYSIKDKFETTEVEYKGRKFKGLKEVAEYYKISLTALYSRIRRGWSLEQAIRTEVNTTIKNSGFFKYHDNFYTLTELAKISKVKRGTLKARIRVYKWSVEQAVDLPKLQH